jgi:hypothetical protein
MLAFNQYKNKQKHIDSQCILNEQAHVGVFFHRLLGCISVVPQVGLIQGLTLDPLGYIRRP